MSVNTNDNGGGTSTSNEGRPNNNNTSTTYEPGRNNSQQGQTNTQQGRRSEGYFKGACTEMQDHVFNCMANRGEEDNLSTL